MPPSALHGTGGCGRDWGSTPPRQCWRARAAIVWEMIVENVPLSPDRGQFRQRQARALLSRLWGTAVGGIVIECENGVNLMARIKDLREYLRVLESLNDVERIDRRVSAGVGGGGDHTAVQPSSGGPAPFVRNTSREPKPSFRLLGAGRCGSPAIVDNPMAAPLRSRLDLAHDTNRRRQLVEHLVEAHRRPADSTPKLISIGNQHPAKQNILLGDDATLDHFPIPPFVHPDGYGGPLRQHLGRDCRQDTLTAGGRIGSILARHDDRRPPPHGAWFCPQQHIGMIWQEWAKIAKPMPFAVVPRR